MLTNIVSFDHLLIMEEIIKMKEDPEIPIDFDLTDNTDEVVLLNLAYKNKNYNMLACLVKLGLQPVRLWGQSYEFLAIRNHFVNTPKYGLEFANQYFGTTGKLIPFKLEQFDVMESRQDQGFFGWGDAGAGWGARLKGGCNFAINWKEKKFMIHCNYVAYCDFGEGLISKRYKSIYTGFDRIFALFTQLFPDITDDFKFFLYQCGTGYYYESDYT